MSVHTASLTPQILFCTQPIRAILTMIDPIEWGREIQIICDVLRSQGMPGEGVAPQQVVAMHNACSDFEYAARWPTPRFGAGAFRVALEKLWSQLTGRELEQVLYGKPHEAQYRFVEQLMTDFVKETDALAPAPTSFYMVGDNPETDIMGARVAGPHWQSILVRTGLWEGGANDENEPADAVVDDVKAAVAWILEQEAAANPKP